MRLNLIEQAFNLHHQALKARCSEREWPFNLAFFITRSQSV